MAEERDRRLRTFGRTGGRPLSARRQGLLEALLPKVAIPDAPPHSLDPSTLFETPSEVRLEIGFGGGEHLVEQAARAPQAGFIGCEPFVEGVGKALGEIETRELTNVRLHMGDARELMARLTSGSLMQIYLLFPDPWPKRRHWKRRVVQPAFLDEAARLLRPGGRLRFATDVKSYADDALAKVLRHGALRWRVERAADWREPPPDHVATRYQAKGLGDCAPVWFEFEKPVG